MKLVVDIDGVLADFPTAFTKILMKIEPQTKVDMYAPDFPCKWDWFDVFQQETVARAWIEVKGSPNFWSTLQPTLNGATDIAVLNTLNYNHEIYFVTNRAGDNPKAQTEAWLERQGFDYPTVIICKDKQGFCNAIKADAIIEDLVDNMAGLECQTFLIKKPYNKIYWKTMPFTAVNTVREALDALQILR